MKILAMETSCDETAAAIVENGVCLISSSLATSRELHKKTGGIVPEVAARRQVESIVSVINETLEGAGFSIDDAKKEIDAIAVTVGPGLIGSLLVGVGAAKTLALAWDKPLIGVNHLVGHIYGNFIKTGSDATAGVLAKVGDTNEIEFPAVVLIVSGGHTDLVLMRDHFDLEYLGGTVDDAAGEAFDKTARLLGISKYLGGVDLSKFAASCTSNIYVGKLPRPKINDIDFDFSFSGLKTAVKRLVEKEFDTLDFSKFSSTFSDEFRASNEAIYKKISSVCCEFETSVCDVLVKKTIGAAKKHDVKSILLGGGVSANTQLRSRMGLEAKNLGVSLHIPPIELCGDNAVYIASAAYFQYASEQYGTKEKEFTNKCDFSYIQADPSLMVTDLF